MRRVLRFVLVRDPSEHRRQDEELLVRQADKEIDEDRSLGEVSGFECSRDRLRVVQAQDQRQVLELARRQDLLDARLDATRGYAATFRLDLVWYTKKG